MISLIQRVSRASVTVDDVVTGSIDAGILALVCAERGDTLRQAETLLAKLLAYRIFSDDNGKMNHSLTQTGGGLLLVPQFTLAAENRGTRPSFTQAAPPGEARELFDAVLEMARARHPVVQSGVFGADMQVSLINNGPVTFWLQSRPETEAAT